MGFKWVRPVVVTPTVEGGYILVRSYALLALWRVYREGHLSLADVRSAIAAILAIHAAKTGLKRSRRPDRRLAEALSPVDAEIVRRLTGSTCVRKSRARLKRLADAGVPPEQLFSRARQPMAVSFGEVRDVADRPVPVPRRLLCWLAREGTAALLASAIAHLLRGAYFRAGAVRLGGTCSARMVAQILAIDERTAKAGRYGLIERCWLIPVVSPFKHRQHNGATFILNPAWSPSDPEGRVNRPTGEGEGVPVSPPQTTCGVPDLPPLKKNKNLPLRGIKNQNRASGSWVRQERERYGTVPTFNDVLASDFDSPERMRALFEDAARRGWIGDSEAERLQFFTTVQHARRVGQRPAALLAALARKRCWTYGTNEDEDRARSILRRLSEEQPAPSATHFGQRTPEPPARLNTTRSGPSSSAPMRVGDVLSEFTARPNLDSRGDSTGSRTFQALRLPPDQQGGGGETMPRPDERHRTGLPLQTQALGDAAQGLGSGPAGIIQDGTQRRHTAGSDSVVEYGSGNGVACGNGLGVALPNHGGTEQRVPHDFGCQPAREMGGVQLAATVPITRGVGLLFHPRTDADQVNHDAMHSASGQGDGQFGGR